ncbi:phosphogluconate dehydratase [Caulobacter sp. S45]|uniref:phosphogluconate dehydratase n=1 Tax=Caulobacter sp. S45 TaxID=1641861 RepID=UPI00131ED185|nr:phosphogluconate dehydratase [Caulobacter sp. S45]
MPLNPVVAEVTDRIRERSREHRADYLARMAAAHDKGRGSRLLSCGNLAHAFAASPLLDKKLLKAGQSVNIGVVNAYNDMLSAHQPLGAYPDLIKAAAREEMCTAQVAGGVPAMCDGVTQGQPGMELSLFSREVIALSTAVSLSHNIFDAALCLGVCDKIVPGLFIGALSFGHLPVLFVPAGPMESGIPNKQKAKVREEYAAGLVGREALLESEAASYHAAGTCTFYGTANSNQMLMELMGVHLPGTAFVNPDTPLRTALTREAAKRAIALARSGEAPMCRVIDERAVVNGLIGLMATGGSTNHTLHMVAMARAAGIVITWEDFDQISRATPLLARVYPNGSADVNHFQAAGGMAFLTRELLDAGLLHEDVTTVAGTLRAYTQEPGLDGDTLVWRDAPATSLDLDILRPASNPFDHEGGLRVLEGNIGRSVIKISAVAPEHRVVEAPARVFHDQDDFLAAFKRGELDQDMVVVVRFQGPQANGMPELHSLTPALCLLQDRGRKVALITDGRMSGASGKVPAAIHLTPEAADGGPIARIRDGDIIRLDATAGTLEVKAEGFAAREVERFVQPQSGLGRELFAPFRQLAAPAELGAGLFFQETL